MTPEANPPQPRDRKIRGRKSYKAGYAFEDKVAEAFRLLGYRVEHGRLFGGRQVDLYLELKIGDLQIRRAIECKAGVVTSEHLDKFLLKLELVRREYPDALGTVVSRGSFTNEVRTHATAKGVQLTSYRELSAQILDGPSYAQALLREISSNERYKPDLFVTPLVARELTGEGRSSSDFLQEWLQDGNWNQLTLLGDVGTGKSFLSRMLALGLANEYLKNPAEAPLPLLIDLRNADREFSLEGLVLTHFAKYGLSRATFEVFQFLLSEGRIVLILDGFDEMASRVTPQITTRNFHELARCVKRSAKVLLTCRTHYFKSRTEEEEVVLGGSGPQSSDVARDLYWDLISRSGFKIAYLRPFTMSQVEQYVRKARPQTAAAILIKIHSIYNLGELSQRPLLLEMIVKSIDKLSASEVNPAQLYEAFTGAWVHRDLWRDLMRPEDKLKFLTALSRTLWEQEKTSIEYQKLEAYVGTELATLVDSPQKLIELDGEIRTASFLVRDDRGQYGFAHSSYAEYFLAKYLADGISAGYVRVLTIRRLTNEVIDFLLWMTDKSRLEEMLTGVLTKEYQPLLSENALLILYRLRRRLLVEEMGRVSDTSKLQVEMPRAMRLGGAKLSQINLEGAIIHDACLDGADLRQCIAVGADLTGSSLADAAVTKGDLQGACLREAKAAGAILTEVNLHGADATKCDFSRADLTGSILTIKQSSGAVFKDAILTAVVLSPDSGISARPQETGPPHSSDWDRERALKQAFGFARRFAARIGAGANSEDIASDVVVYLLSNPTELARLSQPKFNPESICRALVWRRVSTLQREEPLSSTRLRPIGESDFMGEDEDIPDHYRIDILTGQETPSDAGERPDSEYEPETNDIELDTIADSLPSPEETDSIFQEHLENADLIDVLGKFLSEAALKMLIARYVEEETIEEIAKTYGLSDVEVVRRLNMARELARRALRPV